MSSTLRTLDGLLMFAAASLYLGTGWSLVLFQLPDAKSLTPATYAIPFVNPLVRATRFFTALTYVMIAASIALIVGEWDTGYVWVPIVYLVLTIAAGQLTKSLIFPLNARMREGMTDPKEVQSVLARWARLSRIRTVMWTGEWIVMATYFGLRTG
jgi:hypothetical protein